MNKLVFDGTHFNYNMNDVHYQGKVHNTQELCMVGTKGNREMFVDVRQSKPNPKAIRGRNCHFHFVALFRVFGCVTHDSPSPVLNGSY